MLGLPTVILDAIVLRGTEDDSDASRHVLFAVAFERLETDTVGFLVALPIARVNLNPSGQSPCSLHYLLHLLSSFDDVFESHVDKQPANLPHLVKNFDQANFELLGNSPQIHAVHDHPIDAARFVKPFQQIGI